MSLMSHVTHDGPSHRWQISAETVPEFIFTHRDDLTASRDVTVTETRDACVMRAASFHPVHKKKIKLALCGKHVASVPHVPRLPLYVLRSRTGRLQDQRDVTATLFDPC